MTDSSSRKGFSYGAIFQTGEFVQRGDIVGLSVNGKVAVKAPVSGWVRLVPEASESSEATATLRVEIWRLPDYTGESCCLRIAG